MQVLRYMALGALSVLTGATIWGCALESGTDASEEVADVEEAYGEASCGTTSNYDALDSTYYNCGDTGPTHTSGSTYGWSDCTQAYIVKYTGGSGSLRRSFAWPAATTQSACNAAHAYWTTYASNGTLAGTSHSHGSWNGTSCDGVLDSGQSYLGVPVGGRVVAQAYYLSCSNFWCIPNYQPVSVLAFTDAC